MVAMQVYEMAIGAVKKHKRVDISYPRAVMAVFDLIYPEISGHMNGYIFANKITCPQTTQILH